MKSAMETILEADDSSPVLQILENNNSSTYAHSITCSVLAAIYAKVLDWSAKKNIDTLIMGAYLHDIGVYDLPITLQRKPYGKMNEKERKEYEQHPILGYNKLKKMETIPREAALIVLEHHENAKGTGYPRGLLKSDIYPLARVVNFINTFVEEWELLDAAKRSRPGITQIIIDKMVTIDPMAYDRGDVLALKLALSEMDIKKARLKYKSGQG